MGKLYFFSVVLLLCLSCKDTDKDSGLGEIKKVEFSAAKLPKKAPISPTASAILKDWVEFNAFEGSFEALYKAEGDEGLGLVMEDLVEKQKLLEESSFPADFDTPQIKSRLKVIKTYILKVRFRLEYRVDAVEAVIELARAYNAFRKQFTITVNSKLDTNILLDEKTQDL
tara:strand:+ start:34519 stop:35028 length:510 start_codon:yes stop_codon:yes gene_type:complete